MTNRTHHVFFSYARADNGEDNNHFVTRFHDLLCKERQAVTGRELKTFFDTKAIEEGEHWKTRLGQGLRDSRLFLAFLSDNYLKSPVCKWEWEHYLLTEHTAARGEDGVVPLYFIPIDDLGRATEEQLAEWVNEIKQRNLGTYCQLQPWYKAGGERARELDAADRAIGLREVDVESEGELTLPDRVRRLSLRICRRLDRIHLAEQVIGNVVRPYRHFVGRHKQLRELHEALTVDQTSLLATVHSPGGLGKSALARQYAIAYADFYAAGGVWELKCAGLSHLGDALRQLEQQKELTKHGFSLEDDREKPADQQAESALAQLKRITHSRRETVNQQLRDLENRHTPEDQLEVRDKSACLLILDNVDETELLAADQLGLIPAEDWLSVIITTRLSPDSFGSATSLRSIEVPPLSLIEGKELLRTFMPGEAFADAEEAQAAEELVKALDGYTIALELIGAFVHTNWKAGARLSKHLRILEKKGLAATDELAGNQGMQEKIAYQHKQIALIVEDSLASLRSRLAEEHGEQMATAAQQIIEIASLLQPDTIPAPWLEAVLKQAHPDMEETDEELEPWGIILQALMQLSLLSPAEHQDDTDETNTDVLRIHRVTAAHIANTLFDEGEWHWQQIELYLEGLSVWLEQDAALRTIEKRKQNQKWLIAQAETVIERNPSNSFLNSFWVAISIEADHGSLERAISLAELFIEFKRRFREKYPDSAIVARNFAQKQSRFGDLYLKRGRLGDIELALSLYIEVLEIRERLLANCPDPNSPLLRGDLSIEHEKIGDLYLRRGQEEDAKRAFKHHADALKIRKQLYESSPGEDYALALSASQDRRGDFCLRRNHVGDYELALEFYKASKRIREEASKIDPDSASKIRFLSVSNEKLGDLHLRRNKEGDLDEAFNHYEDCNKAREVLYQHNPESAECSKDLYYSRVRLARFYLMRKQAGDAESAVDLSQAALRLAEEITSNYPDEDFEDEGVYAHQIAGDCSLNRGAVPDFDFALMQYRKAFKIASHGSRKQLSETENVRQLSIIQEKLGRCYLEHPETPDAGLALRHFKIAAQLLESYIKQREPDVSLIYQLAACHYHVMTTSKEADSPLQFRHSCHRVHELLSSICNAGLPFDPTFKRISEEVNDLEHQFAKAIDQSSRENYIYKELTELESDLWVAEELYACNPDSAQAARDLSVSQNKLGNFHLQHGQWGDAEQVIAYFKAAVQTFETLLERGKAGPETLQQLVTNHWNVAMVASRAGDDDQMQHALGRANQLLRAMKEKDIPLDSNCEQILAELDQMVAAKSG